LFAFSSVDAVGTKCRILAIGGGTDRGAYEAGAIIGLINGLPAGEAQWDIVTGIGTGAINALMMSQYAIGNEASAATALNKWWTNFNYALLYKDWVGWFVTGIKYESGLYDSSPMKKTLTSMASGNFQRWLGVGATDLLSASYVWFNSTGQTKANMITGTYASVSDYGFFPIVPYSNLQLVSGHIKFALDLLHGVNQCYKLGYTQANITADVVMASGKQLTAADTSMYRTMQVLMRFVEIETYDMTMQVVENAQHDFPLMNVRTVIYPSSKPPTVLYPYDYTSTQIASMIALGQKDAKTALTPKVPTSE